LTTREKAGFTGLEADFSLITIKPD
jgi:hypothetical protein